MFPNPNRHTSNVPALRAKFVLADPSMTDDLCQLLCATLRCYVGRNGGENITLFSPPLLGGGGVFLCHYPLDVAEAIARTLNR